ncbi:hypothetical protein WDU94_000475 [Cyamophila willieti]
MEAEQDFVYKESITDLQKRLETMFNNPAYADTVFTVKQQKFHALSQLVAVASGKLDALMSEHFDHCDDRNMKLYDAKCGESFTVILRYMYGLDINFSQLKISVLCEAINLAEVYQLEKFCNDLKVFLSKVDKFQLDSLAVLLNTSRKYNINELYEKLKVFAFEHAEDFVKHESIVNLQYEVLLNLIKSDWFYAPEIDILMCVLNWHHEMSTKENKETLDKVQNETNVPNDNINGDASSVGSDYSEVSNVLQNSDKDNIGEDNQIVDSEELKLEAKPHVECADDHNTNLGAIMTNSDNLTVLVESFTENVIKSLFPHIRVKQMSAFDLMEASETNLFQTYKHILGDKKLFNQTNEPRQKYGTAVIDGTNNEVMSIASHVLGNVSNEDGAASTVATEALGPKRLHNEQSLEATNTPLPVDEPSGVMDNEKVVAIAPANLFEFCNVKRTIEVDTFNLFTGYYHQSGDSFVIGDLKWTIMIQNSIETQQKHMNCMKVTLQCTPCVRNDYKTLFTCYGRCQLSLVSPSGYKYSSRFTRETLLNFYKRVDKLVQVNSNNTRSRSAFGMAYNPVHQTYEKDENLSQVVGELFWDFSKGAYHEVLSRNKNTFAIDLKKIGYSMDIGTRVKKK